jgi:predicted dehydrogenase
MINIGQIGVGAWGQNLLRNFANLKEVNLKACCDKNKVALEKVKLNYNNKIKVSDDFSLLLKDPVLDAVVVATLPATHAYFAIKALSCGKHVFVEKPLALKIADAQEMIKVARKFKKILMVGHLLLYHPAVRKLKDYIKEGMLGEMRYIYSTRVNLGQVRAEENALWSLTSHDISVAMYLLEKNPAHAQAFGRSYLRKDIQDVVFVNLNFKDDVIAHIHASWLDPHKIRKFTIVGSKKMAIFDDMESTEKIRIYDKGFDWQKNSGSYETFLTLRQGDIHIPKIDMVEPLKLECQHFIDCITKAQRPFTDGENGLEVLKVLDAAQKSLEANGKLIKI